MILAFEANAELLNFAQRMHSTTHMNATRIYFCLWWVTVVLIAGSLSWKVHWQGIHASFLQENAQQKANNERPGINWSRVSQLPGLDKVCINPFIVLCFVRWLCGYGSIPVKAGFHMIADRRSQ